MINFTDELVSRIVDKIPNEYIEVVTGELAELLTHYNIEPVSTELTIYSGYVPECFRAFFVTKKIEGLSEGTLNLYMMRLKEFFSIMNKPFEQITANDVRAYLYAFQRDRKVSNRTLDCIRSILSSFFSWSAAEGYLDKNIMIAVKPIKYEVNQRKALTSYELEKVRAACETIREEALIETLYSTGCRVTELVRLNRSDVNLDTGEVILFGKGNKHRKSYLTAKAILTLKKYLDTREDNCEALFIKERKPFTRMGKCGIEKVVGDIGRKADLEGKLYPHLIRHTFASLSLQRGMDVTEIQKILGHSNISTTMIYAKCDDSQIKENHKKHV